VFLAVTSAGGVELGETVPIISGRPTFVAAVSEHRLLLSRMTRLLLKTTETAVVVMMTTSSDAFADPLIKTVISGASFARSHVRRDSKLQIHVSPNEFLSIRQSTNWLTLTDNWPTLKD
jgi:hypothetical protein